MTTDNRTNEPTPEQVEAAARALREMRDFDEGVSSTLLVSWSRRVATTALVAAADAVPAVQQVSESDALALLEEVIAIHADRIGTHYEDCCKYHVACLAVAVKHRLAGKEKNG